MYPLQVDRQKSREQPKLPKVTIPVDSTFRSLFPSQRSGVESFRYLKRVPYVDRTILTKWRTALLKLSRKERLTSRIERKYCLISTSNLAGLFDVFILLHIWQNCVCFGDFLPKRTLCDAYHKEFESHLRSILEISKRTRKQGRGRWNLNESVRNRAGWLAF